MTNRLRTRTWLFASLLIAPGCGAHRASPSPQDDAPSQDSPCTQGGFDLTVSSLSWSPEEMRAGQPVIFSATVANSGCEHSPVGLVTGVAFSIDGAEVSWSDTYEDGVAPNASVSVTANSGPLATATWTATAGDHQFSGFVDDVNRLLAETDRSNNGIATAIYVEPN